MVYIDVNRVIEEYVRTPILRKENAIKVKQLQANLDSLKVDWQRKLKLNRNDLN